MSRSKHYLPVMLLTPIYVAGAIAAYWIFLDGWLFPADTITGPAWSEPKIVGPGDTMTVFYTLDTKRLCPRVFKTWITNGIVTTFEDHHGVSSAPGDRVISLDVRLPQNLELGIHRYHVLGVWSCNPVKDQIINYPVIEFEVVPKPE